MEPLNLTNALKLYDVLHEYLPEYKEDEDVLEFVGKIVKNIRNSNKHRDYLEAVSIMTNVSIETLIEYEPNEVLEEFTRGLILNDVVSLKEFAKRVGYSDKSS